MEGLITRYQISLRFHRRCWYLVAFRTLPLWVLFPILPHASFVPILSGQFLETMQQRVSVPCGAIAPNHVLPLTPIPQSDLLRLLLHPSPVHLLNGGTAAGPLF